MSRLLVRDLHFSRGPHPILRQISFEQDAGQFLTLLGPSGSGKTTLLWILAGLLRPDRGHLTYPDDDGPPRFGFVFQDGGLWEHLTVHAHLHLVLRSQRLPRRHRLARIDQTLADTGLSGLSRRRPGELSGGERQRLALARALVVDPQWLFLDEPTSQLDGPARHAMIDLLEQRLAPKSAGIILATHQVDLALRLSDRLAVLVDQTIAQIGPPHDVYAAPATLAVAQLLGPASQIQDPRVLSNPTECRRPLIVRPEQLRFLPGPGPAVVTACHFTGPRWTLHTTHPASPQPILIASSHPLPVGATGHIERLDPGAARRQ